MDQEKYLYMYKNEVGIPPFAMIDDLVTVAHCGTESVVMNSYLNAKASVKKMQFVMSKCHKLHVEKEKRSCSELFLDQWKVKVVEETGSITLEDTQENEHIVEADFDEKYVGDIISEDGRNTKNINALSARANGSINQIMEILENICFGSFHYEVAMIFRNSLFLNSFRSIQKPGTM